MEEIKITNPNKILYPKLKITKLDVIKYYIDVANLMLPFIENRPLSVIRCHNTINDCFFKKHPTTDNKMVKIKKVSGEEYFYIETIEQLIFQTQMGSLEFHVGSSNVKKTNEPNVMVFDLDPDENLSLQTLRSAVLKIKSILDKLNLKSFLKTSGGKGYHIIIPFFESTTWDKFYKFSEQIALLAESKWPKVFTTNIRKNQRKNKIFVDYLRNSKSSTCIAPYSLRARDTATISMPIKWTDLSKIKPNDITIKNYHKYLNDAWKNFYKIKQKIY